MAAVKLSIIVPVYRVEDTLDECVRSIVSQSFIDWQLVLVDDGSEDRCPAKCDEWAGKDGRISVIHKANGGLGDARNAGIDVAEGEYLMFVDSDDILAPDTIKPLVEKMDEAHDVDILEFPVQREFADGGRSALTFADCKYSDMREYWLYAEAYTHSYAWNKMYRRRVFADVRFPKGRVFEDMWTLPKLLKEARIVGQASSGCYEYRENRGGITANVSAEDQRSLLEAHLDVLGSWLCPDVNTLYERRYYMHVVDIQIVVCEMTGEKPRLASRSIKLAGLSLRHKIKAAAINVCGMRLLCASNYYFRRLFPRNR